MEPEEKQMIMKLTEDCRKTYNATDEEINRFIDDGIPWSQAGKCTVSCAMQQYQIVIMEHK